MRNENTGKMKNGVFKKGFKRGQFEISETVMVLFIVVIIIALGSFVFFKFVVEDVKKEGETLGERESSVLAASLLALAEIRCNNEDCLDASKFLGFKKVVEGNMDFYGRAFGNKRIFVEEIFPEVAGVSGERECSWVLYNQVEYPENCGYWVLYERRPGQGQVKGSARVSSVVSLYFPEIEEYRIGRITVESYS